MNVRVTDRRGLRISKGYLPLLLIAVGVVVYANSLWGPFIYDDEPVIGDIEYIWHLWPLRGLMSFPADSPVHGRPVVSFSMAVNYALSGYEVWSYHALNLAIHILAGLTLYGIVRRTLLCERLRQRFGEHAAALAWLTAAIWLVHPIQTECVDYISQRTESIMALFYLLTLYTAIRAVQSRRAVLWSVVSVICCGLGMASKEVMVTAPLMVLLYDRVFVCGSIKEAFRKRWGLYLGLAASWGILAALIWSFPRSKTVGLSLGVGGLDYAMNQCVMIVHYLRLIFWPHPLVLDYGFPEPLRIGEVAPYAAVLAVLLVATIAVFLYRPMAGFLGLWFFIILGPTSSFVPITTEIGAERRVYLSLAGVVVLVVAGGYVLLGYLSRRFFAAMTAAAYPFSVVLRRTNRLGVILAVVIVVVLSLITVLRNQDYISALSIWQSVVEAKPHNYRAHYNLGNALQSLGRFDEAISHYCQALQIKPDYADAHNNIGYALALQGKFDEAVSQYRKALQVGPDFADVRCNLGNVLALQGRFDEAIEQYRRVLKDSPDFLPCLDSIARILATCPDPNLRDGTEAAAFAQRAAELTGYRNAAVLGTLAGAYASAGQFDRAITTAQEALELATATQDDKLADHLRKQLELYRQEKPE